MGLAIRPGNARWSYSGFNAFRHALAAEEGIDLDQMDGFGGTRSWRTDNGQEVTPLTPLLYHSDCDGYLDSGECEQVLPRLKLILDRWAATPNWIEHDYDIRHGYELCEAMQHSIVHGCAVVFS